MGFFYTLNAQVEHGSVNELIYSKKYKASDHSLLVLLNKIKHNAFNHKFLSWTHRVTKISIADGENIWNIAFNLIHGNMLGHHKRP